MRTGRGEGGGGRGEGGGGGVAIKSAIMTPWGNVHTHTHTHTHTHVPRQKPEQLFDVTLETHCSLSRLETKPIRIFFYIVLMHHKTQGRDTPFRGEQEKSLKGMHFVCFKGRELLKAYHGDPKMKIAT